MLWYSKHVREMINHIKILIMTWKTFQLQKKAVCLNDALIRSFKATYYAKRDSKTTIFNYHYPEIRSNFHNIACHY